jgi:hypothetical protein
MGALKPWHLICCLVVVMAIIGIIGISGAIIAASRRK